MSPSVGVKSRVLAKIASIALLWLEFCATMFSNLSVSYSLRDAASILKVRPARLRYWKRTALAQLAASVAPAPERAIDSKKSKPVDAVPRNSVRPDFDFRDLVCVRAMLTLVDRGISLRRIRRAVAVLQENLPDLEDPLAALRLWSEGSARIVVQHEGVLSEPEGQMVLDFSGAGITPSEPSSIHRKRDPPRNSNVERQPDERLMNSAMMSYTECMRCFERGCRFDTDPATYKEAISAYERCIELDPGFADAHCNLGAVLYNAGKSEPARRCFERCLEIDRRHVEGHFNLANLLEEVQCDEMALSHYRAALRADPFYAELHVNMALLYERMSTPSRRQTRSFDHWRRYLQLDPGGAWAEVARERLGAKAPRA